MHSDTALESIRRWLMLVSLLLAVHVYLFSTTTSGIYLDNVIRILSGTGALAILLLLGVSVVREYST
ncbi:MULTISPECIES: hypothetical protein [Halorussus]|uniref:hypothetical protein n=1 Tax=Halorussus TaxID=1070314 RepID=UPI00209CB262|nr:hypothetical protein [Halorussus vallis]USZ76671.1 hypothetical protein NGM07_04920 [Halorussus vallis]